MRVLPLLFALFDVLDLLVENMDRVTYGPRIPEQRKGIVGNVTVGSDVLTNWKMYPLSLKNVSIDKAQKTPKPKPNKDSPPVFYTGRVVWVNGVNHGRYWTIGPQQTLYIPECYLKEKSNEVIFLALEPTGDEGNLRGLKKRNWRNKPEPNAPQ